MRSIFLILICLYACLGYSQESKQVTSLIEKCKKAAQYPDSLKYYGEKLLEVAEQTNSDLAYAEGYFAIGYYNYLNGDFERSQQYFEEAADYPTEFRVHARIKRNLAISLYRLGNISESGYIYEDMISKSLQRGDSTNANLFKNNLGILYKNSGAYQKALELFTESLKYSIKIGNHSSTSRNHLNIGSVYSGLGLDSLNGVHNQLSLKYAQLANEPYAVAQSCLNLSVHHRMNEQLDSANLYLKTAMEVCQKFGYHDKLTRVYQNMAEIFLSQSASDSAIHYFNRALKVNRAQGDFRIETELKRGLGRSYASQGFYKMSTSYFDSTIMLSKTLGVALGVSETYEMLSKNFAALGDYKASYEMLRYAKEISDSTYNEDKVLAVNEITAKYNLEEKESVNRQLSSALNISNATISQQRTVITIVSVLLVLVICLAVFSVYQFRQSRSRAYQLEQKNQRIETLMRELHHRVKNNLQVISSLLGLQSMKLENETAQQAVEEGKERIRAMSLIHQKLYQQDEVTSLNIRDYVNNLVDELAQSYGYADKARINIEVPSVLLDADTTLPVGLIINELVSNAFKYAFKNIERPVLELKLIQQQESIMLSVKDNGEGLPEGFSFEKAKSFGLKLVHLLTKQLNGSMQVRNSPGVDFQLSFTLK